MRSSMLTALFLLLPMALSAQSPRPDPAAVERGKTLFGAQCGFCHGSNARGGSNGPDLTRSIVVQEDENGKELQHLRCDFVMEATVAINESTSHKLSVREGNYADRGQLKIELNAGESVTLSDQQKPDEALLDIVPEKLSDTQYEQLRNLSASFRLSGSADSVAGLGKSTDGLVRRPPTGGACNRLQASGPGAPGCPSASHSSPALAGMKGKVTTLER